VPLEYLANCSLQWDSGRKLGNGVFGDVYKAIDLSSSLLFVIKKVNLNSLAAVQADEKTATKMFESEIVALSKFRGCPYVVRLIGFTAPTEEVMCLAYEYCAGGALDAALLDDDKASELTCRQRVRVAVGVSKALNFLHKGGGGSKCWHRDVKSANICLTASLNPKLIDCGLAKFIPSDGEANPQQMSSMEGRVGTMGYRCPEYEGGGAFCEGTEVFAFGVVLLEIMTGLLTVTGEKGNLYQHFIRRKREKLKEHFDTRAEGDGSWPEELKIRLSQLIRSCLHEFSEDRISIQALLHQLNQLETEFCQLTRSETSLSAMREELERSRAVEQLREATEVAQLKTCVFCYDDLPLADGLECRKKEENHFLCNGCVNRHVIDEDLKEKNNIMQRNNQIHCPCGSPGSYGTVIPCTVYSEIEIIQALAQYPETFAQHVLNFAKLERWRLEDVGSLEVPVGQAGAGGEHWRREQELQNTVLDHRRQFELMELNYHHLLLQNAVAEGDVAAQKAVKERMREARERTVQVTEDTCRLIAATTKPCPNCRTGISHWHGHECHHIKPNGGCPACHQHFCYACETLSLERDW
jgi:serine/threonine protein kinase